MNDVAKNTVACVLRILKNNNIPLEKIVLHKFLYFLSTRGVRTGLSFEPYTYGPFSFDLVRTLNSMEFWDELKETGRGYEILALNSSADLDAETKERIEKLLITFHSIVGTFDFKPLELAGTILYCAETISRQGNEVTEDAIIAEFKGWKGERYPESDIRSMYQRVKNTLQ